MTRVYKIVDFAVGDSLYKYEDRQWVNYGKIVLEQGDMFGIRTEKFEGVIMLRKDLFIQKGLSQAVMGLTRSQKIDTIVFKMRAWWNW